MDASSDTDVVARQSLPARLVVAAGELDTLSKVALVCLFIAWFWVDTLVVTLGSFQHGVRFFDMTVVIADPTRLFFTIDTGLSVLAFSAVCLLCLLAPLLPHMRHARLAWVGYLAPLALLVACGLMLYSRTSSEFFTTPSETTSLSGRVIRFANSLVHQGGDIVARHVAVGFGGYLALIASVVLAVQGVRRFYLHGRARRPM